jgi:hypothetical protein
VTAAAHYAAVKARLETDTALAGQVRDTVFDGAGEVVRGSYVVLFGGAPDALDDGRLTRIQDIDSTATYVYTVRSVSTTPGGVRSVVSKVLDKLVGFSPTVTGRRCDTIRLTHSRGVQIDSTVKAPLYFEDDEFTLVSRRP